MCSGPQAEPFQAWAPHKRALAECPPSGAHQRLRSARQRLDRKWISMLGVAHTASDWCACSSCSWRAVPAFVGLGLIGWGVGASAHMRPVQVDAA